MRSRPRPISSARSAESSADCTIASRVTARASSGARRIGVLVHQPGQQLLVERAPIGADPHRLAVLDRRFDDRGELRVLLVLEADIAGIDAIFVERLGAGRVIGEQLVADIMKVADQRHVDAHLVELLADMRHGRGGLVAIDGDADESRSRRGRERRPAATVASTSAVSVLVIDWTMIGRAAADRDRALPVPTLTATEWRRGAGPLARTAAGSIAVSVSDMKTFADRCRRRRYLPSALTIDLVMTRRSREWCLKLPQPSSGGRRHLQLPVKSNGSLLRPASDKVQ